MILETRECFIFVIFHLWFERAFTQISFILGELFIRKEFIDSFIPFFFSFLPLSYDEDESISIFKLLKIQFHLYAFPYYLAVQITSNLNLIQTNTWLCYLNLSHYNYLLRFLNKYTLIDAINYRDCLLSALSC